MSCAYTNSLRSQPTKDSYLLYPTFRTLNCHTTNFGCLEILAQAIAKPIREILV
ncbi:MAG: hypothetical protein F6K41_00460 [Symploca sp. SIO3E6]|nr:hypothetical protein [Caldora sp. SIO3E6]